MTAPGAGPPEDVGSVGEEAAKLLGALQDWARESGGSGPASGLGARLADLNRHVATGESCTYCPVCQVISLARQASPEVRAHLATSVSSLLHALAGIAEGHGGAQAPGTTRDRGVQKINLDD